MVTPIKITMTQENAGPICREALRIGEMHHTDPDVERLITSLKQEMPIISNLMEHAEIHGLSVGVLLTDWLEINLAKLKKKWQEEAITNNQTT